MRMSPSKPPTPEKKQPQGDPPAQPPAPPKKTRDPPKLQHKQKHQPQLHNKKRHQPQQQLHKKKTHQPHHKKNRHQRQRHKKGRQQKEKEQPRRKKRHQKEQPLKATKVHKKKGTRPQLQLGQKTKDQHGRISGSPKWWSQALRRSLNDSARYTWYNARRKIHSARCKYFARATLLLPMRTCSVAHFSDLSESVFACVLGWVSNRECF